MLRIRHKLLLWHKDYVAFWQLASGCFATIWAVDNSVDNLWTEFPPGTLAVHPGLSPSTLAEV
jgi:hypothetical protein